MKKRMLSNEYVSSFCLELSLLLHSGIGIEDGLYLLMEDETDKKIKKMLSKLADVGENPTGRISKVSSGRLVR